MIDLRKVKKLRAELDVLINEYNKTSEIKLSLGNLKYTDETIRLQVLGGITVKTSTGREVVQTPEAKKFLDYQYKHQLKEMALNYPFEVQGKTYEIKGYNSRARKNPIHFTINDSSYSTSIGYIKNIIQKYAPELLIA